MGERSTKTQEMRSLRWKCIYSNSVRIKIKIVLVSIFTIWGCLVREVRTVCESSVFIWKCSIQSANIKTISKPSIHRHKTVWITNGQFKPKIKIALCSSKWMFCFECKVSVRGRYFGAYWKGMRATPLGALRRRWVTPVGLQSVKIAAARRGVN